jgi:HEAT repeat protein
VNVPAPLSADDARLLRDVARLTARGAAGVPGLLQLFRQRSWTVRRAVVSALESQDTQGLSALAQALVGERSHEPTVAGIVDALSGASSAADELVRRLLSNAAPAVLCDAVQIAGRRRDHSAVARLVELTEHEDDNVVLAAVEGLGRLGGTEAVDRLLALAQGDNFFRAFPALEVLGNSREARALPTLQKLLQSPLYAPEATRAIGRIGQLSAVGPLVSALTTAPDSLVRVIALSLRAIQEAVEQNLGPGFAVSRAVREHGSPTLRAKVTRALSQANGADAAALGRLLIWLADEENVADFMPLLGAGDDMTLLAIEGLRKLSALDDPRVLSALEAGNSALRSRLLPALGGMAAADASISACLEDPQAPVRTLACHALAGGTAVSAVPALFRLLGDPDLGVVHAAVGAIQSLGSSETEQLALRAARSPHAGERRAGLRIVLYFGYAGARELALEALASSDERLRDVALSGLTALDDEPGVAAILIEATQHESARTRASAIRALGHTSASSEVERTLSSAHDDEDAWVRYYACQSQGRLRIGSAVSQLIARLEDPAGQVKMAAVEALAAIPDANAGDALRAAAQAVSLDLQRAAIVGMGARQDPALRPVVAAALSSPDPAIRLVATSSIAAFAGAEIELQQRAASDSDPGVRLAAIELLAGRDDAAATSALVRILERDPGSKAASAALGRNIDARIPTLLDLLGRASDGLARALVSVLSRADSRAARAALDVAFESSNGAARRATARVLGVLLDDAAKSSLTRAATLDSDLEVRRICTAAIA